MGYKYSTQSYLGSLTQLQLQDHYDDFSEILYIYIMKN